MDERCAPTGADRRAERTNGLGRAIRELYAARDIAALLRCLVARALELTRAETGTAGLCRDGVVVFPDYLKRGTWQPLDLHFPAGRGVAGRVLLDRRPYVSADASRDPLVAAEMRERLSLRNLVCYPVLDEDGEPLALLEIYNRSRRSFTKHDLLVLEALTAGAAMAIAHVRSRESLNQHRALEQQSTAERLRQFEQLFDSTSEGMVITDSELQILNVNPAFCQVTGYTPEEALGRNPRMLQSGRHDADFYRAMWESIKNTGRWRGEIWNRRKNGEIYPEWLTIDAVRDDTGRLLNYVGVFTDISTIRESQERLQWLAHHDALTDLPNKLLFGARLSHALHHAHRDDMRVAVLFVDLDRFKNVNDTLGHPVGDKLLREVADRLRESVREGDTVARLGGDEFTVILEGIRESHDAVGVAQKIIERIARPFNLGGHDVYLTASIGISVFPENGRDNAALLRNADTAMYRAKERGRNNYQFYTRELTTEVFERLAMENSLRRALERGEFELQYQPQFQLTSGRLMGAEALIRWRHRDLGLVGPTQFIPLAEEIGIIEPIGRWILDEACRQARAWRDGGLTPIRIAVNLSGFQLLRGTVVKTVRDSLAAHALDGNALELELTESLFMDLQPQVIATLDALKELGANLTIDDFGTGYSSLGYLKRLPIDRLKIDGSFIRDITHDRNDEAIARAAIALGRSLQIEVIAEGVETPEQEAFLRSEGCDLVQGYRYGHPVTAEAFVDYLGTPPTGAGT